MHHDLDEKRKPYKDPIKIKNDKNEFSELMWTCSLCTQNNNSRTINIPGTATSEGATAESADGLLFTKNWLFSTLTLRLQYRFDEYSLFFKDFKSKQNN